MLYITLGETDDMIFDTKVYFNFNYDKQWLNDDLVKDMIMDIDKSEVISPDYIESPELGQITPRELSGGVKTLILMLKEPEIITYASNCGNNCAKWILAIAEKQDIHIGLGYIMNFGNPEDSMDAIIENDGTRVYKVSDFELKAIEML